GVRREQTFEREEIVALDDQVSVQSRPLCQRKLHVDLKRVMGRHAVIVFHGSLALELNDRHGLNVPTILPQTSRKCSLNNFWASPKARISLLGRQSTADSASQSEAMTVAVGFSPREVSAKTVRRGAT